MKKILSLVIGLVLIIGLTACQEEAPKNIVNVKIAGLKGPTSIGMIKNIDETPDLGDGFTASYDIVSAPDVLVGKLLNGEYDFATVPTNMASILYNKKQNYQIAGIPIWGMLYVVSSDDSIQTWEDFKGETVYPFAQGSTPDIIFQHLADFNNLTVGEDVEVSYAYQQAELAQALIAGEVSVAVLPEPFVTSALLKNKDLKIVMDVQEEWKKSKLALSSIKPDTSYPMTALIVRTEFAENHPEIVESFMQQYTDSINWVNDNPKDAAMLVEKHEIGFSAAAAELAIPRANMEFAEASQVQNEVMSYFYILNDFSPKTIGGAMPNEEIFYSK